MEKGGDAYTNTHTHFLDQTRVQNKLWSKKQQLHTYCTWAIWYKGGPTHRVLPSTPRAKFIQQTLYGLLKHVLLLWSHLQALSRLAIDQLPALWGNYYVLFLEYLECSLQWCAVLLCFGVLSSIANGLDRCSVKSPVTLSPETLQCLFVALPTVRAAKWVGLTPACHTDSILGFLPARRSPPNSPPGIRRFRETFRTAICLFSKLLKFGQSFF